MNRRAARIVATLGGVAFLSWIGESLGPSRVNYTTVGFAYLLLVLIVATAWGLFEALLASLAATLTFNFFFLPTVGRFTIADPQNWVALFSFLVTALVAGRLSTLAKQRAIDAAARQKDVEQLYAFSRALLLIDNAEPFAKQLVRKLAEIFDLAAVVLYERRAEEFYRAGPSDFEGMDDQLHQAALTGSFFADAQHNRTITAVRLGSKPIAVLALQGALMPDSVLQGTATSSRLAWSGPRRKISLLRSKRRDRARNCARRCWMPWLTNSRLHWPL